MPTIMDRIEIDRIENLVRNFGWDKIKEKLSDDSIELTIKKRKVESVARSGESAD